MVSISFFESWVAKTTVCFFPFYGGDFCLVNDVPRIAVSVIADFDTLLSSALLRLERLRS